jgi:superfamily II DNA/RNA helicase
LWIKGQEQVLVATSALGAGVDVAGVVLVVHAGRPHGLIDFVQEVGRGGRGGEKVQSVVVIEDQDLAWLRTEEARVRNDDSKEAMREFLISRGCRRVKLGCFLDGESQSCAERRGERCDECLRQQQEGEEEEGERAREEEERAREREGEEAGPQSTAVKERWGKGPQLWRERVKERALAKLAIEDARAKVGKGCAACWMVKAEGDHAHEEGKCDMLKTALGQSYGWLRRSIKYEANSCCYSCSQPADWCGSYTQRTKCAEKDIVVPILLAGWSVGLVRRRLEDASKARSLDEFVVWLGQRTRVGGVNMTNAVKAATLVLQERQAE